MDRVIEVRDLTREYITNKGWIKRQKHTVRAVDGITFHVNKGEVFGLLGENGAGKTTTIKMLITLLAPTSGECKVLGYNTFGEEGKIRHRINFIFGGELGVYRRLSARDNLRHFANLYKVPQDVAAGRIAEVLETVGLTEKADLLVETYSKGMIQRLQIARGLINEPEILFMDEPTVGLDPIGARDLRNIIKALKAQGKTVVLTTHYMYEADELCDRIAIINKGKLAAIDTPEKLKQSVHGSSVIEITAEELSDGDIEAIRGLRGVNSATVARSGDGDAVTVNHASEIDVSGEVLHILRERKILSLTRKELTLEDAFVMLVGEGKE